MMSTTHAAIALSGTTLLLATADPLTLGLAILGSQLPDLDTSTSLIGQVCFPVSSWLEDRYPHRSVTHSLLATGAILRSWAKPIAAARTELALLQQAPVPPYR